MTASGGDVVSAGGGNGVGHGGPARGYSWPPFEEGHALSRRHGIYSKFALLEAEPEIDELVDALRGLLPVYASAFEPAIAVLAGRLWRLRRCYAFIEATPLEDVPAKVFETTSSVENLVSRGMARLGLDPLAAAELGVSLSRLAAGSEAPQFDWNALDGKERRTLERLLAKGRRVDDGD